MATQPGDIVTAKRQAKAGAYIIMEAKEKMMSKNKPFPIIVCLCGSTRFKQQFIEANFRETMAGKIVLSVGWFGHADGDIYTPTEEEKRRLDELHLRKIDLASEVLIINCESYIGASTSRELAYAQALGKIVRFWEGCPACGNSKEGVDLYTHRSELDTLVCRECGHQWDGLATPNLLSYLEDKRERLAD